MEVTAELSGNVEIDHETGVTKVLSEFIDFVFNGWGMTKGIFDRDIQCWVERDRIWFPMVAWLYMYISLETIWSEFFKT